MIRQKYLVSVWHGTSLRPYVEEYARAFDPLGALKQIMKTYSILKKHLEGINQIDFGLYDAVVTAEDGTVFYYTIKGLNK